MSDQRIPDEVLRLFAETDWPAGSGGVRAGAFARELLEARELLRFTKGAMDDVAEGRDGPGEGWAGDWLARARSLLPKEDA